MKGKQLYKNYVKRLLDIFMALGGLIVLSPVMAVTAILVRMKLGSPVIFTQERPGKIGKDGKEKIFRMYKFRSMTDERLFLITENAKEEFVWKRNVFF